MDLPQRMKMCRLIAGILFADDDFEDREGLFLARLCKDLGLGSPEDVHPIVEARVAAMEMMELPAEVREEAFSHLLDAACADGKVLEAERDYLRTVAGAMGIAHEQTDQMIALRVSFI